MPKPQPADERNPLEVFDIFKNPAIVIAGLGSLFTRNAMTTAFNSAAGAINGFRSGQQQVFQENKERWHQAATQALEQNQTEITKYKIALEQKDMKARMAAMYALASQTDDPIIKTMMQKGDVNSAYGLIMEREKAQTHARAAMQQYEAKNEAEDSRVEQLKQDPGIRKHAQAIVDTKEAPITGMAAWRNPTGRATMEVVEEIAKESGKPFDQSAYSTRQKIENSFTAGAEGKQARSLNNAIGHLATMDRLVDALQNSDYRLFNLIMQGARIQSGSGQAVADFKTAASIVGSEVAKAVTVGGGALADREEIRKEIESAAAPAMLHGPLNTARELLARQFEGLKQQYESGGGQKDFDKTFMRPDTLEALQKAEKGGHGQESGGWTYEEVK
jgi:hypothetical protein